MSHAEMDVEILECLKSLRKHDSDSVTAWMSEDALCVDVTGQHSRQTRRIVRGRLKRLAARGLVMWKVIDGGVFWALNEGQFRGAPQLGFTTR